MTESAAPVVKTVVCHLNRLLRDRVMSQRDLARETGLYVDTIANYVHGKTEPPVSNALLVAAALRLPVEKIWEVRVETSSP